MANDADIKRRETIFTARAGTHHRRLLISHTPSLTPRTLPHSIEGRQRTRVPLLLLSRSSKHSRSSFLLFTDISPCVLSA